MEYIFEPKKTFRQINLDIIKKAKLDKLIIICLSGIASSYPNDFKYVVYDEFNILKAQFIKSIDAKGYALFLKGNRE